VADDSPITPEDRGNLIAMLERRVADLEIQLERLVSSSSPVSIDLSIGRLSRIDALQQQQIAGAARRNAEAEKRALRAALRRVQAGTYGECVACGGHIGRNRLAARPATPFCRQCEEEGA
jgi:DnaK suppressor protein